MKRYDDDPDYIKGVDVLAPEGFGEVVGGSEREDNLEVLLESIRAHNLPEEVFKWYTDLRRYGSVPHSGFGLGFERTVMWITGCETHPPNNSFSEDIMVGCFLDVVNSE